MALAGRIVDDREVLGAGSLAEHFGISLRPLQRLLSDCVGVGPKWVIQCYRMHDAIA